MLTYFQAFLLGALQGITELFPVSSLGHSVILPRLLGWNVLEGENGFLIFLVATHFATALVLFGFFFDDWMKIIHGIVRSLKARRIDEHDTFAKLGWLLIVATIPAGVLGLLFEEKLKQLFATPSYAAFFLFLNGLLLLGAEEIRKKKVEVSGNDMHIAKLTWKKGIFVGSAQAIALLPGFSRTGATLGGGLLVGLGHEDAARFSFLLATPIIGAAAILKLPELMSASSGVAVGPTLFGALVSGIAAYFSVRFLSKYFKSNDLSPFGYYCLLFGAGAYTAIMLAF